MKVLALDFDGVISDSAPESFLVAVRTFSSFEPESWLTREAATLEGLDLQAIKESPLYTSFVDLMPLGNRAEDFGVALKCLSEKREILDQKEWDVFRAAVDPNFIRDFHQHFYLERTALRELDPKAWLALLNPFAPFINLLRKRQGDGLLCLATAKDRPTIQRLLEAYLISDLFPEDRIFDKEAGVSKRFHLAALQQHLNVAYDQITFVDDKLNHLEDVAPLGVRGVLAGWGYNGPRERMLAQQRGFTVCDLEQASTVLF